MDFPMEGQVGMSTFLQVLWTITPRTIPQPLRPCSRCGEVRPFNCSGKFRLNANGKRLVAWLIYKCTYCDSTWNRPILQRRNRRDLDPLLLHALQTNDRALVQHFAFDVTELASRAERIEEFADVDVRKAVLSTVQTPPSRLEILLTISLPIGLRTDRLLARELGLPRKRIQDLLERGVLAVAPGGRQALRRPMRDGMRIVLDLPTIVDSEHIVRAAIGFDLDASE
jgi:hypothetical protein